MSANQQILQLPDGRRLGYAQFGELTGKPVFYFTGGQSSRLDGRQFDSICKELNIRLITTDRPGIGNSDFQVGRQFLDWPGDIAALADSLGIDTFSVFGLSGGGPHVLATAYQIPDRLDQVAIVSGTAPMCMPQRSKHLWFPIRVMFFLARYIPWLHRKALQYQSKSIHDKDKYLRQMQMGLPEPDKILLENSPEVGLQYLDAGIEGYKNGIEGDFWEWQLYVKDWKFPLEEISKQIDLWYGQVDGMVSPQMGEYLAQKLPNSNLHIVPDGGHFSTIHNYIRDILTHLR